MNKRIEIIKNCYGAKAFNENIKLHVKKELVTAWWIEGIDSLQELENIYSDKEIQSIYDSGI